MIIKEGINAPIKSWCNSPEEGAMQQAMNLSALPFIYKQVMLMPDTHQGYGMPIGGVIGTVGAVIPNAVGVDIGCGMCAIKTSLNIKDLTEGMLKEIMGGIREGIPVGFNKHKEPVYLNHLPVYFHQHENDYSIIPNEINNAMLQLGTLGGGNHFIEIQKDTDGSVWIMIHSGSRHLGKVVADYYNKLAIKLNSQYHSVVSKEMQLAFLPLDTKEAQAYMRDMQYCVAYAFANRRVMMEIIQDVFWRVVYPTPGYAAGEAYKELFPNPLINIAHNYASIENHYGKNVVVHRKGATSAKEGEIGIIPGSQGTSSYIVSGKGNKESFMSCSHGAGRAMSRSKARAELDLESEQKRLNDLGVIHSIRTQKDLDEASSAYKSIDIVMEEQKDLVDIVAELKPLAVVKG